VSPALEAAARRLVTIPLFGALALLAVLGSPLVLGAAALADLVRGGPWVLVRCAALVTVYLCCEVAGLAASFAVWLASGVWAGASRARFLRWNRALQLWWARTLLAATIWIFDLRLELDVPDEVGRGPAIVFIRHSSIGDTLLPVVLLTGRHGLALRYVLKRELLWDPCLDVVGNRLPNYFVRRGSGEGEREVAAVAALAQDLGPHDGVLIYPEGTRFTPAKRARILDRTADPALRARAAALTHVLPPRLGGPLALLERARDAAAVFCAHVGFESAGSFRELLSGALVRRRLRVRMWRVPPSEIPSEPAARAAWFHGEWARIDEWIGRQLTGASAP
jgi:1-acyl-sn-glycerol-3-phosphate acyltransferase